MVRLPKIPYGALGLYSVLSGHGFPYSSAALSDGMGPLLGRFGPDVARVVVMVGGIGIWSGLGQMVTNLLGFAFVAPLAYTRNIWPLVILHASINFSGFLSSGNLTVISTESPEISQVLSEVFIWRNRTVSWL